MNKVKMCGVYVLVGLLSVVILACGAMADLPVNSNNFVHDSSQSVLVLPDLTPAQGAIIANEDAAQDRLGWSAKNAGDVNGDGIDDIFLGSPYFQNYLGSAVVLYGGKLSSNIDVANLSVDEGFVIYGDAAAGQLGYAVSGAGDVNGDGFVDLLVGAPFSSNSSGSAYLIFGQKQMTDIYLNSTNSIRVVQFSGAAAGDYFGYAVSGLQDVNDDGLDDFFIGAPHENHGMGVSYIFFGKKDWQDIDMTEFGVKDGVRVYTPWPETSISVAYLGISGSGMGDVNGDSIADFVLGSPQTTPGNAFVVFGSKTLQDINTSELKPSQGITIVGAEWPGQPFIGDGLGSSVSGAGDVNGDGINDFILGAPVSFTGYSGAAYIIYGSKNLVSDIYVQYLTTEQGVSLANTANFYEYCGTSVSSAGDVNNDGFDDVLIGCPQAAWSQYSYVVYGGKNISSSISFKAITSDQGYMAFGNSYNSLTGFSVSGIGDTNSDGFDDLIISSPYADVCYVVYGAKDGFVQ
jgi:hypothetical protein